MTDVRALVPNCTLKPSPTESGTDLLGRQLLEALGKEGATGEVVRVDDHDVRFGVSTDEGGGDAWPTVREKMLAADLMVIATPIWMGQPASVAKRVLGRHEDHDVPPEETASATSMAARNAVHLARLLQANPYPAAS